METPLRTLAEAVNAWHGTLPRSGDVELAGRRVPAAGCVLHRIPSTDGARLLACIDGGSAPIADTPAFAASVNRLYCSAFRGRDIQPSPVPPVQFLSLARLVSNRFGFSLYPHADGPGPLPDVRTLDMACVALWPFKVRPGALVRVHLSHQDRPGALQGTGPWTAGGCSPTTTPL